MKNPWEEISLDDYENHMSLLSVRQLQTMNRIMKRQIEAYPVQTAMVLGIAGGNGLEHVADHKLRSVYCVDINEAYLRIVRTRYAFLSDVLCCLHLDLTKEAEKLPRAELLIANLLIEYIGYDAFQNVVKQVGPAYVSCVIQINTEKENWISDSPYLHSFDRLDEIHCQMEENKLVAAMKAAGYRMILKETEPLPNGKALERLDFQLMFRSPE